MHVDIGKTQYNLGIGSLLLLTCGSLASKTVFGTDTEYTFRRCNNSTAHPFSIGGATGLTGTNQLSFTTGNNDAKQMRTRDNNMVLYVLKNITTHL